MKKSIGILLIIVAIIAMFFIFFVYGNLATQVYNLVLTILLLIILPKDSKIYAISLLIIGAAIPILQDFSDYLSPKPEVFINMNRVFKPSIYNATEINVLDLGNYELLLVSSAKYGIQAAVLKREILFSDHFYFSVMGSQNESIPFTYIVHMKNKGARTKEPIYGDIRISSENFKCSDQSLILDLDCKRTFNPFEPQIFWKTKSSFPEGGQAQFIFWTELLELPEINCQYDGKECFQSIYDLAVFEIDSFPFYMVLGDRKISIPDYGDEDTIKIYNPTNEGWDDFKKVFNIDYVFQCETC